MTVNDLWVKRKPDRKDEKRFREKNLWLFFSECGMDVPTAALWIVKEMPSREAPWWVWRKENQSHRYDPMLGPWLSSPTVLATCHERMRHWTFGYTKENGLTGEDVALRSEWALFWITLGRRADLVNTLGGVICTRSVNNVSLGFWCFIWGLNE